MGLYPCDNKQGPSITLDAGYVSVTSVNICQSSKTIGLYGRKLICVICISVILFLISLINLTCLVWLMYKLDWSLFGKNGSKVFRFDKINQQVEFYKQVTFKEPIYTTKVNHQDRIDLLTNKQFDIYGHQHSFLLDDERILFNMERFHWKNQTVIDFTNLQAFKFDYRVKTRVHLDRLNSQHIHHKHLNLTANNQLRISHINQAFFYSHNLVLEANRHNRRSILRFHNHPKRRKTSHHPPKISSRNLRFKSDSIFLDLPRLPLLGQNYRSESGVYRICICNTTFLFLRTFAHQPCPHC